MSSIDGILARVRCGTTTVQDAEAIEARIAMYERRVHELEAANRAYWLRYGDPPELPEMEPA